MSARPYAAEALAARSRFSAALTPPVIAGFAGILIVVIATFAIGVSSLKTVHAANQAVARNYAVKLELHQILTTMVDAETGQRGFILTGATSYLEPYEQAHGAVSPAIAHIRMLMTADPEQRPDAEQLAGLAALKLTELEEAIRRRRDAGFAAAQAIVATNVGKRTMDQMRVIVARMDTREDAKLAAHAAQADRAYTTARLTRAATTAAAVLALAALFALTIRFGMEQARAMREAERQAAELREALQQKDDFVAIVSHDLRTPMNTIVGWARMLEQRTISPDANDRAIASIVRGAMSMHQLIEDRLDTNQLVSGRMRLTIDTVDFERVVGQAIDTVRLSAENKGVAVIAAIDSGPPPVRGDADRLRQVVWNLLGNAIKFTPEGGRITVTLRDRGERLRLEVTDTGEGITPEFLPHVFERYRQGVGLPGAQRGVGLGLAIVHHLVELHGGTVSAHSDGVGRGATFIVELPAAPVAAAAT